MKVLRREKERLGDTKKNLLGEVLNNIKMLKLFGLEDNFSRRVQYARDQEMQAFKKMLMNSAWESAFNSMVPQMIPAVVFFAYIGMGNSLDLAVSLIALSYFDRLISTISMFPEAVNKYNELIIAFTRI